MSNTSDKNNLGSIQSSRIVRVRDLPIYYDSKNNDIYRYISRIDDDQQASTNNNSWLHSSIRQTRRSLQRIWNNNKNLRLKIARGMETGEAHAKTTFDYVRDDQTLLPKIGFVTIAGLGGLLLGHKGGILRKTFYSSAAVTIAFSTCYPKQSVNLLDQVYVRIKIESKNLFDKAISSPSSTIENKVENKDRILHTVKSQNEPIATVKGDYGQSTLDDQYLYTTRGNASPTMLDTEKRI